MSDPQMPQLPGVEVKLYFGIEQRLDILDLYARQSHFIDGGDATSWAATFTADGSFASPTYNLTAIGHEALRDFAASSHSAALGRGEQYRHLMNNLVIEALSEDRARIFGYLQILATKDSQTRIDRSLRVIDDLAQVQGKWLVVSRRVFRD